MNRKYACNNHADRAQRTSLVLLMAFALIFGASAQAEDLSLASAQTATEIQLVEKDTDVYYLQARLGDAATSEFLFDTGSGYLAINEEELARLKERGEADYQRAIRARMASGKVRSVAVYLIATLDLGGGCVLRNVEAAILPGATRNILGMNVLKMVDSFSVSFNPAKLVLSGCSQPSADVVASL